MAPFSRRLAAAALAALLPTCLAVTVSYHHPSFKDMKIHEEHTMHDTDWTACAQATSSILNPLAVFDVIKFHVTNPERPITVYGASEDHLHEEGREFWIRWWHGKKAYKERMKKKNAEHRLASKNAPHVDCIPEDPDNCYVRFSSYARVCVGVMDGAGSDVTTEIGFEADRALKFLAGFLLICFAHLLGRGRPLQFVAAVFAFEAAGLLLAFAFVANRVLPKKLSAVVVSVAASVYAALTVSFAETKGAVHKLMYEHHLIGGYSGAMLLLAIVWFSMQRRTDWVRRNATSASKWILRGVGIVLCHWSIRSHTMSFILTLEGLLYFLYVEVRAARRRRKTKMSKAT